ncbi:MAG: dimethyladenosine transferase [Actinomycetia bacterium]|nr:dimethyladenosine transferase [Actinomycetes bacterium]MCP4087351.1 dimethyladenosine transferase [Actinomycetes bacterium]
MSDKTVSRTRVIAAPANEIFNILADPTRHPEIDGSGSVRKARLTDPERLELGSRFGMDMHIGVPYRITNTVVEYEQDRLIAWRHFGRHRWRYELEPVDGGTRVIESFDWSTSPIGKLLELARYPQRHGPHIEETLERLEAAVTSGA